MSREEAFTEAVGAVGPPLLDALHALEQAFRHLHPPRLPGLRRALAPRGAPLRESLGAFRAADVPEGMEAFADRLETAATTALASLASFAATGSERGSPGGVAAVLRAMREHAEALAALYPLARVLPPVSRFFLEPPCWPRREAYDATPAADTPVGIHHASDAAHQRGGFTLYVPEWHDGATPLPLVVALHGGSGHGRHFLWSWLREARSRGLALLAPTSRGPTWSLAGRDADAASLHAMVDAVRARWPIDEHRMLLTGLSDGGTYALLAGLREDSVFTALAPVAGVLHPGLAGSGSLARARGRRILWVHGALDWMFPIGLARAGAEALARAGAELAFREIADLSHAYPREANDGILRWLDPALALPAAGAAEPDAER